MRPLSHMYRSAWRKGLKTTYYLRTRGASNIEKATTSVDDLQEALNKTPTDAEVAEYKAKMTELRHKAEAGGECESCT